MLKALNQVLWLAPVCKVAWYCGMAPNDWQSDHPHTQEYKKGDRSECTNYPGISLLSLPGKLYAKWLENDSAKYLIFVSAVALLTTF